MDGGEGDGGAFGAADLPDDDAGSGERVHGLVAQGRFTEAHALVGDAFVERNGSAGYLLRAWILAQEKRGPEAREAVDWALAIAGPLEAADVFVLAGVVLLSLDEAHAALAVALRAAGVDPGGWEPSVLLSDVYRRLGRVPDAAAAARRAVAVAPNEAEAQVALARSLSAGRSLFGRVPQRHRAEHQAAVERALMLGADPGQLVGARGGAVAGGLALAVFWGIQLYRMEQGGAWQFVAAGVALVATVVLIAVVMAVGSRRSGTSTRARLRGIRATTRTEMAGDDWLWRISAARVGAVLPVPPLVTTGLVADRAWRDGPWPLWAVGVLTGTGLAGVLITLATVRWWFGPGFTRRAFVYSWPGRLQLAVVFALLGGTLALAARGDVPRAAWADLASAHLTWTILAWIAALLLAQRAQVQRNRAL